MAQFFDVLSQVEKSTDAQFYTNVEDQTVQYVITPEKTQVQYPTQQIVVTSGEPLMVVDGQPQQIVIDQSAITYPGQQIQQTQQVQQVQVPQQQIVQQQIQVQNSPQYAVIQDGSLNNGTQQIFFMDSSNTPDRVIVESSTSQPIVLNHQIGQTNIKLKQPGQITQQLRSTISQPPMQQQRPQGRTPMRSPNPNQQSPRPTTPTSQIKTPISSPGSSPLRPTPNQQQPVRHSNPNQPQPVRHNMPNQVKLPIPQAQIPRGANQQQFRMQSPAQMGVKQPTQQIKQLFPGQQIRVSTVPGLTATGLQRPQQSPRPPGPRAVSAGPRFPQMQLQQKAISQGIDLNDLDIKSNDEKEAVSLPDGTVVSVAAYKKILMDQKSRLPPKPNTTLNQSPNPKVPNPGNTVLHTPIQTPTTTTTKKRNPPKNPRQPPKSGATSRAATRNRNVAQFGTASAPLQQQQQVNNDPSRYAMMSQHIPQGQQVNKPPPFPGQQLQQMQQQVQQAVLQQPPPIQQPPPLQKPSQANYVIQPPKMNQRPQQQRPLPPYIPSSQIQKIIESTPISEEFSDSIRMLVLLENGEQRLITFTLPKEACTIQEILEQVNVPFQSNTNIQVTEANSNGINYIVTVGNVPPLGYEEDESPPQEEPGPLIAPPTPPHLSMSPPPPIPISLQQSLLVSSQEVSTVAGPEARKLTPSPDLSKEVPKLVAGMLALCSACGYLSEDFAKCVRCQRKLPDNVKAIPATIRAVNGQKRDMAMSQQVQQNPIQPPVVAKGVNPPPVSVAVNPKSTPSTPTKKKSAKSKVSEPESVHVISSDEEDDEKPSKVNQNILEKLGSSVTICPISKEPSPNDIQRICANLKNKVPSACMSPNDEEETFSTNVICRTVRIGSYRCIPAEKKVIVDSNQVFMKVPHPSNDKLILTIIIEKEEILKVLASFNPALPVFFYYLHPSVAQTIREQLDMTVDGDYYYDPLSTDDESYRRITLLPDDVGEDDRDIFQMIYGGQMEELNVKEANDILIKTCPKELTKATLGIGSFTEIKQLLTYPPEGKGRISINTEDYVCLAQDQFLNDVIIDFYLKYTVESLPEHLRTKVHVFSTFFYKRLTTKPVKASRKSQPSEVDPTLTSAQKRHARVKTWTKNVNLFEKDFVIVPINENAHWFLAIICFPGMNGCQTWDGKPYVLEVRSRKKKVAPVSSTPVAVKPEKGENSIVCEDPEVSDKDEAEGDDSEMESDDSEELPASQDSTGSNQLSSPPATPKPTPPPPASPTSTSTPTPKGRTKKEPRPPIKQPCVLIFDSLAGASRCRVVATLRDYLTCEYKAKLGKERIYTRDIIKGACPKVPQQNNFTDCGLYVLQYVEQFFKDPIKDYNIPIKQIQNWFDEIVVTKKREEIANLIKTLMKEYGKNTRLLPDVAFPTVNGKVVDGEREFEEEEEEMMDDEEESAIGTSMTEEESDLKDDSSMTIESGKSGSSLEAASSAEDLKSEETPSPLKPSSETVCGDFVSQTVSNLKPDLREFPRQTNKDTLLILKAKRISRHKNSDGPDLKKLKTTEPA